MGLFTLFRGGRTHASEHSSVRPEPCTDAEIDGIADRAIANLDWDAIVRTGEPAPVIHAAVRRVAPGALEAEQARLEAALLPRFKAAWEGRIAAVEDGAVDALVASALRRLDWAALARIWAVDGDDKHEVARALHGIDDGSPEYSRLLLHRDPERLVNRIVAGVQEAVVGVRLEWDRARRRDRKLGPGGKGSVERAAFVFHVCGVPDADRLGTGELRAAWIELMKRHHPDGGRSSVNVQEVNAAYDVLRGRAG